MEKTMKKILALAAAFALAYSATAYARTFLDYTQLATTPASGDVIVILDVDDATMSAAGTTKYITYSDLGVTSAFVDQDVTSGSSPTFDAANITGVVTGSVEDVFIAVRNASGSTIEAGRPVYISGYNAGTSEVLVELADASAAATMPAIGLVHADLSTGASGQIHSFGSITALDTSTDNVIGNASSEAWAAASPLYVSEVAGELTDVKPTGTALIQKVGVVDRSHGSQGVVQIVGAGRTNDVPNLPATYVWVGNASAVATGVALSGDVTMDNAGDVTIAAVSVEENMIAASLVFDDGDLLDFGTFVTGAAEGIMLPAHATDCTTATAEGQVCWEEDAKILWVGDGAAPVNINGSGAGDITSVFDCATGACTNMSPADATLLDFGSNVTSATEGLMLPAHATDCSTATAEGQVCWEEDAKKLWIGDGAAPVDIAGAGGGADATAFVVESAPGTAATATGTDDIAIGDTAVANGAGAIAIGVSSDAGNAAGDGNAIAIGATSQALGVRAIAVGNSSTSSGTESVALGDAADAGGTGSIAIGDLANSPNVRSISIGANADATATEAIAIGSSNVDGDSANATAVGAVALGKFSNADDVGQFSYANDEIASPGDAQTSVYVLNNQTTDDTPTILYTNGATATGNITIASDSTTTFDINCVGRRTDGDSESGGYQFFGVIDNNAGTTALVGSVQTFTPIEDTAGWAVAVTANNTTDAINVTVTGVAGNTINWVCRVETVEVTG